MPDPADDFDPTDPATPAYDDPSKEEIRRSDVSVAEMVEDHPDPAGEVKLRPLVEPDPGPEDVDGW